MVEIGHATKEDIPELCRLLGILFSQEAEFTPNPEQQRIGLEMILARPEVGQLFVAKVNGHIVGMVNLLFSISTYLGTPVAIIEDVVVQPEVRGQGIGSALIDNALAFAKEQGCGRVSLLTDGDNKHAQAFYARHGFETSSMMLMRRAL